MLKTAALFSAIALYSGPSLAEMTLVDPQRTPKKITAVELRETSVEVVAVTRRARANTVFHRHYIDESLALNKAYPGYPKPAYVSLDIRVQF